MEDKRILIVEDDDFLRQLCSKKLKQLNYQVDMVTDGISALKKIKEDKPNLVLLDVIMPGMEGFDVLKEIRSSEDGEIADIPIVMLSNLGQESDKEKAKKLGANDYLVKAHFTTNEIAEKVEKYIK